MSRVVTLAMLLIALSFANSDTQTQTTYADFLSKAAKNFGQRATKVDKKYKLADFDHWGCLQSDGLLRFSKDGVTKVVATAQILGSYSSISGTWMWSWANTSVDPSVRRDIPKVREFGEKNRFDELIEPKFACNESARWRLATVAGEVLNAKGAFRGRIPDGWVYFLITDIRRVEG